MYRNEETEIFYRKKMYIFTYLIEYNRIHKRVSEESEKSYKLL